MNQPRPIHGPAVSCHKRHILSVSHLIAQRPDHYTGIVLIRQNHGRDPVQAGIGIAHIISRKDIVLIGDIMTLHICLIHHIKPIPVTEFIKASAVRIMGTADRIDVVLLHHANIPFHLLFCNRPKPPWAEFMVIDSFYNHMSAVDTDFSVFDLDFAESHRPADDLRDRSILRHERETDMV